MYMRQTATETKKKTDRQTHIQRKKIETSLHLQVLMVSNIYLSLSFPPSPSPSLPPSLSSLRLPVSLILSHSSSFIPFHTNIFFHSLLSFTVSTPLLSSFRYFFTFFPSLTFPHLSFPLASPHSFHHLLPDFRFLYSLTLIRPPHPNKSLS